jgi:hypothetical protein
MDKYTCPRCSQKFAENDDIWFMKNAGYVGLNICVFCVTPTEKKEVQNVWHEYLKSKGLGIE